MEKKQKKKKKKKKNRKKKKKKKQKNVRYSQKTSVSCSQKKMVYLG